MRGVLALLLSNFIVIRAHSTCDANIHEEMERERKEDFEAHECRACGTIDVWAYGNCPQMGYECDEDLKITTRVLSPNDCNCAQLRCLDPLASIAVNRTIVGKLHCKGRKWMAHSEEAESAVCARKCGTEICPLVPSSYFNNNAFALPLVISPPDAEHPCAWGECEFGAIAKTFDGSPDIVFEGPSQFSCSGDRSWTYTGPGAEQKHLRVVVCVKNDCHPLPFDGSNALCHSTYACYEPDFVEGNGEDWKAMTCPEPGALRTEEDNKEIEPTCKAGVWFEDSKPIDSGTKVMCVTCPNIEKEPSDAEQPTVSEHNKEVTCANGKLAIEFEKEGTHQVSVTSLKCSGEFAWVAEGGLFTPFPSFEYLIKQGIKWKVRCLTDPPACKSCLKSLISITTVGAGSHSFFSDDIDTESGTCAKRKFTCKGVNANIEINHRAGVVSDKDDGVVDGVASFVVECNNDGSGWMKGREKVEQAECASAYCQKLTYDPSNAFCVSKYLCYEPEFVEGEDPKKMKCRDEKALRLSADNKEITPTCQGGVWSEGGKEIDVKTRVMCINCPNVEKEPTDKEQPTVSEHSKEVTCSTGQLTIEFEKEGTHQVSVTSLKCSGEFAWVAEGGVFTPLPSFEDLIKQGIKWKVRCLTETPKDCKSCPLDLITKTKSGLGSHDFDSDTVNTDGKCAIRTFICKGVNANIELNERNNGVINDPDDGVVDGIAKFAVECNNEGTGWMKGAEKVEQVECASADCQKLAYDPSNAFCRSKYLCYEPKFAETEDPKKMKCLDDKALRLSADNKEIAPTCKGGVWSEGGSVFDEKSKVTCINCPNVEKEPTDKEQPTTTEGNKEVTCAKGTLTIEYEKDGPHKTPVATLKCSPDFAWTTIGGVFTPYSSFEEAVNDGVTWKARCITETPKDCKSCPLDLITKTKSGLGSHDFESDDVNTDGQCAVRTFICKGTNANIELNSGVSFVIDSEDGVVDSIAKMSAECNEDGTEWKFRGGAIIQVECATGV